MPACENLPSRKCFKVNISIKWCLYVNMVVTAACHHAAIELQMEFTHIKSSTHKEADNTFSGASELWPGNNLRSNSFLNLCLCIWTTKKKEKKKKFKNRDLTSVKDAVYDCSKAAMLDFEVEVGHPVRNLIWDDLYDYFYKQTNTQTN